MILLTKTQLSIHKSILNSLNFSYIPMLENLPKLTEKTFVNTLRKTPKINDIKPFIENNIKINKENLEKLKLKINILSLNLKQI